MYLIFSQADGGCEKAPRKEKGDGSQWVDANPCSIAAFLGLEEVRAIKPGSVFDWQKGL